MTYLLHKIIAALTSGLFVALALPATLAQDRIDDLPPGEEALALFERGADEGLRAAIGARYRLLADIDLEAALAELTYRERGYSDLRVQALDQPTGRLGPEIAALRRSWIRSRGQFEMTGVDAELAAVLLLDVRLPLREQMLLDIAVDREELRGALALLYSDQRGCGSLEEIHLARIVERTNLATRRLCAARADLWRLAELDTREAHSHLDLARLKELLSMGPEVMRREGYELLRRLEAERASLGLGMELGSFDRAHRAQLGDRRAARDSRRRLRYRLAELAPFTEEGRRARPEIAMLEDAQRLSQMIELGIESIEQDPFDPWTHYMVAEALDYRSGIRYAAAYFDHFLVLRGIHYHDHRTYGIDSLDKAEFRAVDALLGLRR